MDMDSLFWLILFLSFSPSSIVLAAPSPCVSRCAHADGARRQLKLSSNSSSNSSNPLPWWSIRSGECEYSHGGHCITDGPGAYSDGDGCVIDVHSPFTIRMGSYHVESAFDYLRVTHVSHVSQLRTIDRVVNYNVNEYPRGPDGVYVRPMEVEGPRTLCALRPPRC